MNPIYLSIGGNTLGFSSMIALFPDSDLVIATLTNIYVAILPDYLHYYLADEILNLPRTQDWTGQVSVERTARLFNRTAENSKGINFPPRQKNSPASHPLIQYQGVYSHPLFAGDLTITLEETNKNLHIRFITFEGKMEHYHFETFSYHRDIWSIKEAQLLTFITGEDGEVQGLQFEYLEKKWTFQKKISSSSPSSKNKELNQEEAVEEDSQVDEDEQGIFSQQESKVQFKMLKTYQI